MTQKKEIYMRVLKIILIIFIPLILLEAVIYYNASPRDFEYFYDIGGEEDDYLTPAERVSDKIIEEDVNYRGLFSQLVYFDVPISMGTESIDIQVMFKNNFPENSKMKIGARNAEEWNYTYQELFNSENSLDTGDWVITNQINFNLKKDSLYIKNGKLNIVFNTPHLNPNNQDTNTQYIPIDWIKITVHKKGWFEK